MISDLKEYKSYLIQFKNKFARDEIVLNEYPQIIPQSLKHYHEFLLAIKIDGQINNLEINQAASGVGYLIIKRRPNSLFEYIKKNINKHDVVSIIETWEVIGYIDCSITDAQIRNIKLNSLL